MDIIALVTTKPVLIGLHLGFAILGIDAFLWLLGEVHADSGSARRRMAAAWMGVIGFLGSWIIGGYYYVKYYGPLVKPIIKAGSAPWAHAIAMEAKEHIFLFVIPVALTVLLLSQLNKDELASMRLKRPTMALTATLAGIGLLIGLMGFIISAAARWGVI